MVTHSRKRGLLNDSEAKPKEGAVQHIKRLHSPYDEVRVQTDFFKKIRVTRHSYENGKQH